MHLYKSHAPPNHPGHMHARRHVILCNYISPNELLLYSWGHSSIPSMSYYCLLGWGWRWWDIGFLGLDFENQKLLLVEILIDKNKAVTLCYLLETVTHAPDLWGLIVRYVLL